MWNGTSAASVLSNASRNFAWRGEGNAGPRASSSASSQWTPAAKPPPAPDDFGARVDKLLRDLPAGESDLLSPEAISAITMVERGGADSLHRLVMDLHKRLNAMQAALAGGQVRHERKQEGPRYRGPSCLSRFIPEERRPVISAAACPIRRRRGALTTRRAACDAARAQRTQRGPTCNSLTVGSRPWRSQGSPRRSGCLVLNWSRGF